MFQKDMFRKSDLVWGAIVRGWEVSYETTMTFLLFFLSSIHLSTHLSIHLSTHPSMCLCAYLSSCPYRMYNYLKFNGPEMRKTGSLRSRLPCLRETRNFLLNLQASRCLNMNSIPLELKCDDWVMESDGDGTLGTMLHWLTIFRQGLDCSILKVWVRG